MFPFTMAFQPVVDLEEQRIEAHEALVRGPEGEGAATVLAQLTPQNLYAFDQACRVKAIELAARLGLQGRLNINFLPNAVYQPRACIQVSLQAARRHGFPIDRLTFEFTENERVQDPAHTRSIIEEYRRQGFQIALDDFGTGYSGLARLAELRPDILKLDRRVIQDCDRDPVRLAIIRSLVTMARDIGVKLVAEGVEREGEMEVLRAAGMRYMQGFHFARPVFEGLSRWPLRD
ncbi:EAL domain-containing protein [Roseococcus suduntuyensis]|uniref:EAL domain-containing protein (Putative c-di-GMP-specific phosphodiesterase class I) n=1 Tax=Roseococcus suduntuyensis TaxID=455361 RepID=A0A840AFA0_9PROT|nr:EAL domain-containing protein [Roseococcus suduntuyensis]MBB3899153.1 EAL domain-containing protein (putative c-di-GMP-specific phosphodiesterase class I) [Roseococcus suduntuyensis]